MSTSVTAPTPALDSRPGAVTTHPVTFGRVLAAEWVKFRTLRSSWITLAVAFIALVGLGALVCWGMERSWNVQDDQFHESLVGVSLVGVGLAELVIGVLGVLVISGEYGTGMIRSSFAAVPSRLPVLFAKALLFGVIAFVAMLVGSLLAFVIGQGLLGPHGVGLGAPHALAAIFGTAGFLALVGVMAVAIGAIIRNTAGGIAVVMALLLVVPILSSFLPQSWRDRVLPYLPSAAGESMYSVDPVSPMLSALGGTVCFAIWCVVLLAIAAVLMKRRDA